MAAPDAILQLAAGRPIINANGVWFIMKEWWRPGLPCLDINNNLNIPASTHEQRDENINNIAENMEAGDYDDIIPAEDRALINNELARWRNLSNNIANSRQDSGAP